jgi:nicotinic acid mononucleotide adenylyltransferase
MDPKIIETIKKNVRFETAKMIDIFPSEEKDALLLKIIEECDARLGQIKAHLNRSIISPSLDIAIRETDYPKSFYNKALRIGVYPISANPIHWGHLLVALSAIAQYSLDKVVFIIAGDDPRKSHLAPCQWRHYLSDRILERFHPLLAYSNIARNYQFDGETNIFRFLTLNPFQKIDAFYIVGTDHYYRLDPKRKDKDTVQKLEENIKQKIHGFNDLMHSVSIIFARRKGGSEIPVETGLNAGFIPALSFEASSTMVREAINNVSKSRALALLPYTVYESILSAENGLFPDNRKNNPLTFYYPSAIKKIAH